MCAVWLGGLPIQCLAIAKSLATPLILLRVGETNGEPLAFMMMMMVSLSNLVTGNKQQVIRTLPMCYSTKELSAKDASISHVIPL